MSQSRIRSARHSRQGGSPSGVPQEGPGTPVDFGQSVPGTTPLKPVEYDKPLQHTAVEVRKPAKAAKYLAARLEGSDEPIQDLAKRVGIPHDTARCLEKRLNTKYAELKEAVEPVSNDEIESIITRRMRLLDKWLTDERLEAVFAQTKGKDMAVMEAIWIDKLLALRGTPVATISVQQQHKMDELMPALLEEMKRRGLAAKVINVEPEHA